MLVAQAVKRQSPVYVLVQKAMIEIRLLVLDAGLGIKERLTFACPILSPTYCQNQGVPCLLPSMNIAIYPSTKESSILAVVVAQLVDVLLSTTEIRSSNPVIGKILSTSCTI